MYAKSGHADHLEAKLEGYRLVSTMCDGSPTNNCVERAGAKRGSPTAVSTHAFSSAISGALSRLRRSSRWWKKAVEETVRTGCGAGHEVTKITRLDFCAQSSVRGGSGLFRTGRAGCTPLLPYMRQAAASLGAWRSTPLAVTYDNAVAHRREMVLAFAATNARQLPRNVGRLAARLVGRMTLRRMTLR